jgi:DNA polymerase-3 subunit alpha
LEDLSGIVRCILWPEQFAQFGELVEADAILGVRGTVDRRPGAEEVNLIVTELLPIDQLSAQQTSGVVIRVREDTHGAESLEKLREIVRGYPGSKELKLQLDLAEGGSVLLKCPNHRIDLDPELRRRVEDLLGPGNFRLVAEPPRATNRPTNGRRPALARN